MTAQSISYRPTRAESVGEYLAVRLGRWVPGYNLTTPEVGGSEGLKRLRELRAAGFTIEKRRMANSHAYEYRMTGVTA